MLAPKPTADGNGCNLKPLQPDVPGKALLLVVPARIGPLRVVYPGKPGFQWPELPSSHGWDALPVHGVHWLGV